MSGSDGSRRHEWLAGTDSFFLENYCDHSSRKHEFQIPQVGKGPAPNCRVGIAILESQTGCSESAVSVSDTSVDGEATGFP